MAIKTFGNGLQYNTDTGEVVINDNSGKQVYKYDPNAVGGGKTYYGGQTLTGMYNPLIIAQMSGQNLQDAYQGYLNTNDKVQQDYNSTPNYKGKDVSNQQNYWRNMNQGTLDQLAFNKAYQSLAGKADDQTNAFFAALKNQATAQSTPQPSQPQAPAQPAVRPVQQPISQPVTPQQVQQPTNSTPAFQAQTQQQTQAPTDTSATQPNVQPDYAGFLQAVYNQVAPYFSQPSQNSTSSFSSPTFQIGSPKAQIGQTPIDNSPTFSLGGYNPQQSSIPTGSSGKTAPVQESSQGMATGKFGSK